MVQSLEASTGIVASRVEQSLPQLPHNVPKIRSNVMVCFSVGQLMLRGLHQAARKLRKSFGSSLPLPDSSGSNAVIYLPLIPTGVD